MIPAVYIGPTELVKFHCDGNKWREWALLRHGTKGHCVKNVFVGDKVCFCPAHQPGSYALLPPAQCMSLELDPKIIEVSC